MDREVRVERSSSMGRRAASNDDVAMAAKSGNKSSSLPRRTNTALAKSFGPSTATTASRSSSKQVRGGFDESGRETDEEDEEGVDVEEDESENTTPRRHRGRRREKDDGEEESGDGGPGGHDPLRSDPRLAGLRRTRVSSLPPTQAASTEQGAAGQAAAIPRHLLLRQRSESHPPDRFRPLPGRRHGNDTGNTENTRTDNYEFDEDEDEDEDRDGGDEDEQEDIEQEGEEEEGLGNESGTRRTPRMLAASALSPRRLYLIKDTDTLPSLDLDFELAAGEASEDHPSSSSSALAARPSDAPSRSSPSSSTSVRLSSIVSGEISPPVSPSSSPPQPTFVPNTTTPGQVPRTNSFGTMSPRKANARRLLMSTSLSSSAIMKAPPLFSPLPAAAGLASKRTGSSNSLPLASPSRRATSSASQPMTALPALVLDEASLSEDARKDRRLSTSIHGYEFEFRAAEMGWSTSSDQSGATPTTRTRSSLRSSDEDAGSTSTSTSSSAYYSPKHSRSRSINRLSCSAQLHPSGSVLRNAISPRALPELTLAKVQVSSVSPGDSPRSPGHSPLSSPKAIPSGSNAKQRSGSSLPSSCSPPSPMTSAAPTPATTPSSSASSTSLSTRPDSYNSYARAFKPITAYTSGSEESEEGESSSSSLSSQSSGVGRRRRGGGSGIRQRGSYRDSDGSGGSGESDFRESESDEPKGEGSGGETGGGGSGGGGGPFLYRADSLGAVTGFSPRKSLFADPKKRYKSHTLHHHRSPRSHNSANYHSMGVVAVPLHRVGRSGGSGIQLEDDIQAMHAAKEERKRAKAERVDTPTVTRRKYGSDGESSTSSNSQSGTTPSKPRPTSMRASTSSTSAAAAASSSIVSPRSKRYSLENPARVAKTARSDDEIKERRVKEKEKEQKEKEKEKEGAGAIRGIRMSRELKQEIEQKGGTAKRALRSSAGVSAASGGGESEAGNGEGPVLGERPPDNILRRIQAFRQSKGKSFHTLPSLSENKPAASTPRDSSPRENNLIRRKNSKDTKEGAEEPSSGGSADVSTAEQEAGDVVEERKRRDKKGSRDGTAEISAGGGTAAGGNERKHRGIFHSFVSLPRKAGRRKAGKGSSKEFTPPTLAATPRSPRMPFLDSSSGSHPTTARRRLQERTSRAMDARRRRSTSFLECQFGVSAALSTTHSVGPSVLPPSSPRLANPADASSNATLVIASDFPTNDERRRLLHTISMEELVLRSMLEQHRYETDLWGAGDGDSDAHSGEHHQQFYDGSSSGDRISEGHSGEVENYSSVGGGSGGSDSIERTKQHGSAAPSKRSNKVRGRAGPIHSPKLSKKNASGKAGKGKQQNGRPKEIEDNRLLTAENFDQLLVNRDLLLTELVKPGLRLIRGLLSVVSATTEDDPDGLCQALVAIADRYGQITQLMKLAIAQELNSTTSPFTLFREDGLGTKFLSTYAREKGGAYLTSVLKPVIKKVITSHTSYEMDPLRIPQDPKASREENQRKLEKLCQHVLDAIFSRQSDFPLQIISSYLYAEVNLKFPFDTSRPRAWSQEGDEEVEDGLAFHRSSDWGLAYVGAFIFLRFFCPAIVSPKPHGIVKRSPTREAQRGLMLVAKTLQTMANQLRFGDKEPYMKPMNQFIEDNQLNLENYLRALTQKPPKLQSQTRFVAPEKEKKTMRDKFSSSSNTSASSSLLNLSSTAAASFVDRSSSALAHSSAADPGDEESAQLAIVQACCTRNQRKLLTFYYSSSLPFLSALSQNSASSSAASSPNNSPSSSAPPTPSSSAPPTPSSRSVSPRTGALANLAPQASAALHPGSSPRMKSEE